MSETVSLTDFEILLGYCILCGLDIELHMTEFMVLKRLPLLNYIFRFVSKIGMDSKNRGKQGNLNIPPPMLVGDI